MQVNTLLFVILDVCFEKNIIKKHKINGIFHVCRRPMDSVGFSPFYLEVSWV